MWIHLSTCSGAVPIEARSFGQASSTNEKKRLRTKEKSKTNGLVVLSPELRTEIDMLISGAIIESGWAFNILDSSPKMLKVFRKLLPGYRPPSRKKIVGELLNKHHDIMQAKVFAEIERSTFVGVVTDS